MTAMLETVAGVFDAISRLTMSAVTGWNGAVAGDAEDQAAGLLLLLYGRFLPLKL